VSWCVCVFGVLHCIASSIAQKTKGFSALQRVWVCSSPFICASMSATHFVAFQYLNPKDSLFWIPFFFFFSSFSRVFVTSEFPASILEIFLRRFLCGQLQIFLFSFLSSILLPFLLASFYHPQRQDSDSDCSVPFCCVMLCPRSWTVFCSVTCSCFCNDPLSNLSSYVCLSLPTSVKLPSLHKLVPFNFFLQISNFVKHSTLASMKTTLWPLQLSMTLGFFFFNLLWKSCGDRAIYWQQFRVIWIGLSAKLGLGIRNGGRLGFSVSVEIKFATTTLSFLWKLLWKGVIIYLCFLR